MSVLNKKYFRDEAAAFSHLESLLWVDGVVCPHCGTVDQAGKLNGVRSKPSKKSPEGAERHGLWKCYSCRKQFTVTVGTVFEDRHIPLHKMLQAVYLLSSSKKGISSHQLHRTLEVTYKTAWFLSHRIREAMRNGSLAPMGGAGAIVEMDETYIGRLVGQKAYAHGGASSFKNTVLTLVERGVVMRPGLQSGERWFDSSPALGGDLYPQVVPIIFRPDRESRPESRVKARRPNWASRGVRCRKNLRSPRNPATEPGF